MSTHTDPQDPSARCDYCGRPREEVGILVPGANAEHPVAICRACVTQAGIVLDAGGQQRPSSQDLLADIPSPRQVVEHLDRSVIGQGRAAVERVFGAAGGADFIGVAIGGNEASDDAHGRKEER